MRETVWGRPGQVDAGHRGRLVRGAQPEFLDRDDDAEALGEQFGEDARNGLPGLFAVEPAAYA